MALTLQEGAREESSEEGTGAQIAAWLGTPRPLSHVVGTKAPEDFTNTEGEPLAPRIMPQGPREPAALQHGLP